MIIAPLQGPGASPLACVNPFVKLVAFSSFTLAPVFFLDPATPLAFLLLAWGAAWPLAQIAPWRMAWQLRPYLLLAAGLALFNALFYGGEAHEILLAMGPLHLTREGAAFGAAIALRLLCMITYTTLYFATTEPTPLVNSLILQARLPYSLGFTILAAYRFLPILQQEMEQIRAAQRIRTRVLPTHTQNSGWSATAMRRSIIPLLAGGIRRAERLALAMDGRGFGANPTRSYYVLPQVTLWDALFLTISLLVTATILLTLAHFGLLNGWLVGVAEQLAGSGA
jgi:energy-coupling factor transport system permease protein